MSQTRSTEVRLDHIVPHGTTIVHSEHSAESPLRVESPAEQWAYAISVPLGEAVISAELRPRLKVSARVSIESGKLQGLLTAGDFRTLLGGFAPISDASSDQIELFLEELGPDPQLIFRNAGGDGRPCHFTVESVWISADEGDSVKWSLRLADVMAGTPARIVIEDLHNAVVGRTRLLEDDLAVFDRLRRKWSTVPAGLDDRRSSGDLLALSDRDLREFWETTHRQTTTGDGFHVRGWYQTLYRDVLRHRKVLEIGSGMGIDGIEFARHGAAITFVDIVENNLAVMERLCRIFGIRNARFLYLRQLSSLDALDHDYDVVWCQGSQINVPFEFARRECACVLSHLKDGGRWIELAYPRERWQRDGAPPFSIWGNMTDGEGTPWMEWYDLERLQRRLQPTRFRTVLALNFHNDDFNWFDLVKL
jgi:SAM-dependent methyltransferase